MSKVLVVTELVSIVSEKVTETFDVIETEVSPSEGELDETVGGVVSVVVVVSLSVVVSSSVVVVLSLVVEEPSSLLLLQEMMERLNSMPWMDPPIGGVVLTVSVVDSSLSSLQEMMVRLKQKIRKTNITFFIFTSIPKVKYYCFV